MPEVPEVVILDVSVQVVGPVWLITEDGKCWETMYVPVHLVHLTDKKVSEDLTATSERNCIQACSKHGNSTCQPYHR